MVYFAPYSSAIYSLPPYVGCGSASHVRSHSPTHHPPRMVVGEERARLALVLWRSPLQRESPPRGDGTSPPRSPPLIRHLADRTAGRWLPRQGGETSRVTAKCSVHAWMHSGTVVTSLAAHVGPFVASVGTTSLSICARMRLPAPPLLLEGEISTPSPIPHPPFIPF